MKRLFYILTLLFVISCVDKHKTTTDLKAMAELKAYEDLRSEEESTKKLIGDYLRDLNSPDWRSKLPKYLQPDPEEFLEEHAAFRESFRNYKATIKHMTVDGNEAIVWINTTANYAKTYVFKSKNDEYGDNAMNNIEAKNQALSWDETWYFNVVDGKFGTKWDFLKDHHAILENLKAVKSP